MEKHTHYLQVLLLLLLLFLLPCILRLLLLISPNYRHICNDHKCLNADTVTWIIGTGEVEVEEAVQDHSFLSALASSPLVSLKQTLEEAKASVMYGSTHAQSLCGYSTMVARLQALKLHGKHRIPLQQRIRPGVHPMTQLQQHYSEDQP
jgi:hypothetical protein